MASLRGDRIMVLKPSELGTKKYWDNFYEKEHFNFMEDCLDTGTEWFSDVKAGERMVRYIREDLWSEKLAEDAERRENLLEVDSKGYPILDLGTGNAHLLIKLFEAQIGTMWHGVDYSEQSISLAHDMLARKGISVDGIVFALERFDVMGEREFPNIANGRGYALVLDKGTFDAISLSARADAATKQRTFKQYAKKILPLVQPGGHLLITSCNWSETELKFWIEGEKSDDELIYKSRIEYPKFRFGGVEGQSVCTLCFQRKRTSLSQE